MELPYYQCSSVPICGSIFLFRIKVCHKMMICNFHSHNPQKMTRAQTVDSQRQYRLRCHCQGRQKLDSRQWWFFFGLAPLAVLAGWSLVAVWLTGNWAWEWPSGLLLSSIGSTAAIIGNLFRFR